MPPACPSCARACPPGSRSTRGTAAACSAGPGPAGGEAMIAAARAAAAADGRPNRAMVTVSVMLATIMQALDTTIANVALPEMQGTMGATQEQIAWVLTSYIVAAAIVMPLTGFVAARIGRRRLFLWAVGGFTVASLLCVQAQYTEQLTAYRLTSVV